VFGFESLSLIRETICHISNIFKFPHYAPLWYYLLFNLYFKKNFNVKSPSVRQVIEGKVNFPSFCIRNAQHFVCSSCPKHVCKKTPNSITKFIQICFWGWEDKHRCCMWTWKAIIFDSNLIVCKLSVIM